MIDEYFVLETENNNEHPLLSADEKRCRNIATAREVDFSEGPLRLRLGEPIPKRPKFVDLHVMPQPVISLRIHAALEPMKLHRVQFVPAAVHHKGEIFPFYIMNVMNSLPALDLARSKYTTLPSGGIGILEKISLADNLAAVTVDQRLVFCAAEYSPLWFFHKSVVKVIEAVEPVGFRFIDVDNWDDAVAFR